VSGCVGLSCPPGLIHNTSLQNVMITKTAKDIIILKITVLNFVDDLHSSQQISHYHVYEFGLKVPSKLMTSKYFLYSPFLAF